MAIRSPNQQGKRRAQIRSHPGFPIYPASIFLNENPRCHPQTAHEAFCPPPFARFWNPKTEKPLMSHLEGPGCVQGGLVDLPQPFC